MFSENTVRSARLRCAGIAGTALLGLLTAGAASADTAFRIELGDHHRCARHAVHRHHARCGHAQWAHYRPQHHVRHAFALLAPHMLFDFDKRQRSQRRHESAAYRRHENRRAVHSEERSHWAAWKRGHGGR